MITYVPVTGVPFMVNGYDNDESKDFPELDEWLCEYVDGTIDPAVCAALEDYMCVNPDLAHHVERLRHTRHLLGLYGCRQQAPAGLQPRLRRRLAWEMRRNHLLPISEEPPRPDSLALFTSMMFFVLLVAMMPGDAPMSNQRSGLRLAARAALNVDIPMRTTPLARLVANRFYSRFSSSSPLPVLYARHPSMPAPLTPTPADTMRLAPTRVNFVEAP